MYRATTLAAFQNDIDTNDNDAVSALAEKIRIEVLPPTKADGRQYTVLLDEDDVTWQIRQPDVDANVSIISAYPRVRAAMVREQRRVAHRGRVVMVGRDIGTVVMPDADLKIYLDASVEERARRRYAEMRQHGTDATYESVLHSMRERDYIDSTRVTSPLRPAEDAIIVDCTSMDAQDTLEFVIHLVDGQSVPSPSGRGSG